MKTFITKNKSTLLWLLAILILGTFSRFYNLGELSFNADEFLDINATVGYAQTGQWQAWDFNFQQPSERINQASDERAWMYRWQVAQLFAFLPPTEFIARSISALWGVLSIAIIFFVAWDFTKNRTVALIAAFLFAISPTALDINRTLRMYAMFAPIFLLLSWALFRFLEPRGKALIMPCVLGKPFGCQFDARYILPILLLGLLSFHLHMLTGNIVFILLVYCFVGAYLAWRRGEKWKSKYSFLLLLSFFGFILAKVFVPTLLASFMAGIVFFDDHWSYVYHAFFSFSHYVIVIALMVLGWIFFRKQEKAEEGRWIMVSFLTLLFAAILLWNRNVGPQYFFFAHSFLIILIASGMYLVASEVKNRFPEYKKAYAYTIIFLLLLVPNYAYFFQENTTYRATSTADSPNYRETFMYFKKHLADGEALITRNFRSYYFHGATVPVYNFGGELSKKNFSMEELQQIMYQHKHGWFIFSDNDENYISNEVEKYVKENFEKIDHVNFRGKIHVYRW